MTSTIAYHFAFLAAALPVGRMEFGIIQPKRPILKRQPIMGPNVLFPWRNSDTEEVNPRKHSPRVFQAVDQVVFAGHRSHPAWRCDPYHRIPVSVLRGRRERLRLRVSLAFLSQQFEMPSRGDWPRGGRDGEAPAHVSRETRCNPKDAGGGRHKSPVQYRVRDITAQSESVERPEGATD